MVFCYGGPNKWTQRRKLWDGGTCGKTANGWQQASWICGVSTLEWGLGWIKRLLGKVWHQSVVSVSYGDHGKWEESHHLLYSVWEDAVGWLPSVHVPLPPSNQNLGFVRVFAPPQAAQEKLGNLTPFPAPAFDPVSFEAAWGIHFSSEWY